MNAFCAYPKQSAIKKAQEKINWQKSLLKQAEQEKQKILDEHSKYLCRQPSFLMRLFGQRAMTKEQAEVHILSGGYEGEYDFIFISVDRTISLHIKNIKNLQKILDVSNASCEDMIVLDQEAVKLLI